jgi:dTDP-4-amino-4,6-dideoxygalactose transaminase
MTSGTWDRHRGHAAGYDVVGVGYNYRLDEPRAALLIERMKRLEDDIAARRGHVHRYRELLDGVGGLTVPFTAEEVDRSSCYVMPVMLEDTESRPEVQKRLLERHGVQTSVLYAALQGLSAYQELAQPGLERSELAARTELTIPLYPHLATEDQDRVVAALAAEIS